MLCLESGPIQAKYRQSVFAGLLVAAGVVQYCLLDSYLTRLISGNPEVCLFVVRALLVVLSVCACGVVFFGAQSCQLTRQMKEQADLTHDLRYQSEYDVVSGLKNRNAFARYAQQSEKGNLPASVFVCDIDGLKMINDTLGHMAGDVIIREAAKLLLHSVPEAAGIFRLGGDEFVVVLPAAWPDARLQCVHERIKEGIEAYNRRQPAIPLSLSVGYAASSEQQALWEVVKQADCNMYQEKRAYQASVCALADHHSFLR